MDEKTFWKYKNWDEPEVPDILKISNTEIERRYKISTTHQLKWHTDPEYAHKKRMNGVKSGEAKRKVPLEDYADICRGYFNINGRPANYLNNISKKYGVKKSVIEKIAINFDNLSLPKEEFEKIKNAFYEKFPLKDIKSNSIKKMHNSFSDEKRAQIKLNISIAQDPVDADTAVAIYGECRLNRSDKFYRECASRYRDKNGKKIAWEKVREIVNGHHYATKDFDIEDDIKEYRLRRYGTFKFTSPDGEIYHFENEKACGEWMLSTNTTLKDGQDPYRVCISMFDRTEPNTPKLLRRQFWKGWTIENIKKVDK